MLQSTSLISRGNERGWEEYKKGKKYDVIIYFVQNNYRSKSNPVLSRVVGLMLPGLNPPGRNRGTIVSLIDESASGITSPGRAIEDGLFP